MIQRNFTPKIYNSVSNIELSVIAEIGKVSINVEDLLKLEVGDVIVTNKKINDYIDIFVENSKYIHSNTRIYIK